MPLPASVSMEPSWNTGYHVAPQSFSEHLIHSRNSSEDGAMPRSYVVVEPATFLSMEIEPSVETTFVMDTPPPPVPEQYTGSSVQRSVPSMLYTSRRYALDLSQMTTARPSSSRTTFSGLRVPL